MHMKSSNKLSVFVTLFIMMLLGSCDFVSSYDFRIHNQTEDSISIEMTIKCPPYSYFEKNGQRFNCYENYYRPEIDMTPRCGTMNRHGRRNMTDTAYSLARHGNMTCG